MEERGEAVVSSWQKEVGRDEALPECLAVPRRSGRDEERMWGRKGRKKETNEGGRGGESKQISGIPYYHISRI